MDLPANDTDAQLKEFNLRQEFVRDASPNRWIEYSSELESAAAALWTLREERMQFTLLHGGAADDTITRRLANPRACVLLAGFALENSLKAQLIIEHPDLITDAKLLKPLKTHCLTGLMDRIKNLTFSEAEREIATICESATPYWGRYPVPLDFSAVIQERLVDGSFHEEFAALNFRIRKAVHVAIKDGWNSGVGPSIGKMRSREFGDDLELDTPFPWCVDDAPSDQK